MNVLHIGIPHVETLVDDREIQVDNPDDPFGVPVYVGPASGASAVLKPGSYWYVYTDEEDWDI